MIVFKYFFRFQIRLHLGIIKCTSPYYPKIAMVRNSILLLILLIFSYHIGKAQPNLSEQLNHYILKRTDIDSLKKERIKTLRQSLNRIREKNDTNLEFRSLINNVEAYEYFVYDSAFKYAEAANKLAYELNDLEKIAESKSKLSLIMLLKGLYTSSIDTINSFKPNIYLRIKGGSFIAQPTAHTTIYQPTRAINITAKHIRNLVIFIARN